MRSSLLANILLLLASGPALTWAADCQILECPSGWSSSSCNSGTPDFCCPGAAHIEKTEASCCIGGDPFSHTCADGTLVPVGDDMAAYTSSVNAALSSSGGDSKTFSSPASAATKPPKPVTTTDASGSTVTSIEAQATAASETKDAAAAAAVTGLPGAAVGIALGVVMVARNV